MEYIDRSPIDVSANNNKNPYIFIAKIRAFYNIFQKYIIPRA